MSSDTLSFFEWRFDRLKEGERIEIRAFHATGGRKSFREFCATPEEATAFVATIPSDVEVYYGVNPRRGQDGSKKGVTHVTCLWADVDDKHFNHDSEASLAAIMSFELEPSMVVRTGGGWQAYWFLVEWLPAEVWGPKVEELLRRLYVALGGMDNVQDLSRIFRVPGTWNNKRPNDRREVLIYGQSDKEYTLEEIEQYLPALPPRETNAKEVAAVLGEEDKPDEATLRQLLTFIDPCLPYQDYFLVWAAVAYYCPGDEGLRIVDEWSSEARAQAGQYSSPRTQPEKHAGFKRQTGRVTTIGTLLHYAKLGGYEPPRTPLNNVTSGRRGALEPVAPDTPWLPPLPLSVRKVPLFPLPSLPPVLRDFVEALAIATQTPTELAAFLALAAVATAVARKAVVRVRAGWYEPLNAYFAVVLPSGNRKSAVERAAIAPLREWERAAIARRAPELAAARSRRKIAEARLKKTERDAAEAKEPADRQHAAQEAERLAHELGAMPEPVELQLLADDATPETVKTLLAEQGGRLGILSAEGTVFELMGGRYSKNGGSNLEVYLQGHAGDEMRVNRRGRAELVRDPALSIGVAIQPDVLRSFADRPEFKGRGLVARFLYALPKSLVGRRLIDPPPVAEAVRAAYHAMLAYLLDLPLPDVPAELVLDAHAARRFREFEATNEPRLAEFGTLGEMAEWGSKLPGAVARLAGLLHLLTHASHPRPWDEPVGPATVEAAIAIGEYAIPHALAAADLMRWDAAENGAAYLLRWLAGREEDTLTEQAI